MTQYEAAKKRYAERGVDADAAINTLKSVPGLSALLARRRRARL